VRCPVNIGIGANSEASRVSDDTGVLSCRDVKGGVVGSVKEEAMRDPVRVGIISGNDTRRVSRDFGEAGGVGLVDGGVVSSIEEEAMGVPVGVAVGAVDHAF